MPLKVLLADDHPLLIAAVRRVLQGNEDIEVVGEAHSGQQVMALIERRRPDVVLLDMRMPGVQGTELIEAIGGSWPDVKTVVLSSFDDRATVDAALTAGASAYIVKSVRPADIASVLRQAAAGTVFHATATRREDPPTCTEPQIDHLTGRQRMILERVAAGLTTAEISESLMVSEHTVKFHLTNIYQLLGVKNRAGAVRYALEHGIVALAAA